MLVCLLILTGFLGYFFWRNDSLITFTQPVPLPHSEQLPSKLHIDGGQHSPRADTTHTDSEILAKVGLLPAVVKTEPKRNSSPPLQQAKPTVRAEPAHNLPQRRKSLKSGDWNGNANLLIKNIRNRGFQFAHSEVMDFLQGKDLLGWSEDFRNWIGDELMTMLEEDESINVFADLKGILENLAAPSAMRDYSVQHISHLVKAGVIGQEGTDYIWQVFKQMDPVTASTALISLHRMSEQVPKLVSAEKVKQTAEKYLTSTDVRLSMTAKAIIKDSQKK